MCPYLLRERADIPVVGSQLTLALIEAKLKEHQIKPVRTRSRRATGSSSAPSTASSSRSTTPSPTGWRSRSAPPPAWSSTPGTSRWTSSPSTSRITDLRGFARLGEEGVDLFMTDSTNAEVPGFTIVGARAHPRDRDGLPHGAAPHHRRRASPATCTASSRSSTPPQEHGRKVAFVGRSMVRNMGVARELGYLKYPEGLVVPLKQLEKLAGQEGRPGLHRLPGRADGRAVPDGQPRAQDPRRPGRHRADGQLGHPRQRERHLPA